MHASISQVEALQLETFLTQPATYVRTIHVRCVQHMEQIQLRMLLNAVVFAHISSEICQSIERVPNLNCFIRFVTPAQEHTEMKPVKTLISTRKLLSKSWRFTYDRILHNCFHEMVRKKSRDLQ